MLFGPRSGPIKMLSFAACAPSPTPPNPSSVGTPIAAVKLPSEPPPVEDSSNFTPSSCAQSRAITNSFRIAGVRSIGGRFKPPSTCIEHRLSKGRNARNFLSRAGASFILLIRMSTSALASAATTLTRVPPETTPGLTVIPRFNCVKPAMRSICRASSTIALAPFSKSRPACDARPFTVTVYEPTPLRSVLSLPSSPAPGSSTSTTALRRAASSVSGRDDSLPTSSSALTCRTTRRETGTSNSRTARTAYRKNAMPDLVSSTPGPHKRPFF